MKRLTLDPIGVVATRGDQPVIKLKKAYLPALEGLEGFSHLQMLWWFSGCDDPVCRANLTENEPYRGSPACLGVFATRSPCRPNPIALSVVQITDVDPETGEIGLTYTDAEEGSPVLDLKPYTPSLDRVEDPAVPGWCAHWPKSVEASGDFDWSQVFNF